MMKNLFTIILAFVCSLSACKVFRPATTTSQPAGSSDQITYLHDDGPTAAEVPKSFRSEKKHVSTEEKKKEVFETSNGSGYSKAQFKYAILTNSPVEMMTNTRLLSFMDDWYGTQYHFGGSTRDGIDCSAFAAQLQSDVYQIKNLPRMSRDQYSALPHVKQSDLQEGDLVFFHTYGRGHTVTHVGVYLYNGHFIHASVSGVMISDLTQGYYAQHYIGASRPDGR